MKLDLDNEEKRKKKKKIKRKKMSTFTSFPSLEERMNIVSSFMKCVSPTEHQINSLNYFNTYSIQDIIEKNGIITVYPKQKQDSAKSKNVIDIILEDEEDDGDENDDEKYKKTSENSGTRVNIKLENVKITEPNVRENEGEIRRITPHECRLRGFSYESQIFVDIKKTFEHFADDQWRIYKVSTEENVLLTTIPIMVKSNYCVLKDIPEYKLPAMKSCVTELGGYFIIDDNERVIIPHERMAHNQVLVYEVKKTDNKKSPKFSVEVMSDNKKRGKVNTTYVYYEEKSATTRKGKKAKGHEYKSADGFTTNGTQKMCNFLVSLHYTNEKFPVSILFKALGVTSDRDIIECITTDENDIQMISLLKNTVMMAKKIKSKLQALEFIGGKLNSTSQMKDIPAERRANDYLKKELFPHISTDDAPKFAYCKALFLGFMVNQLCSVILGRRALDTRDDFANKRVMIAEMIERLFRDSLCASMKEICSQLEKNYATKRELNVQIALKQNKISQDIKKAMKTGHWVTRSSRGNSKGKAMTGVSQVLNTLNYTSYMSNLRRLNTTSDRDCELSKPCQLDTSQHGVICPAETPEGEQVGKVKNLAIGTYISVGSSDLEIYEILKDLDVVLLENIRPVDIQQMTKIFVNGNWFACVNNPHEIVTTLRMMKRSDHLKFDTGIVWNMAHCSITINTDRGRLLRPLLIINYEMDPITGVEVTPRFGLTEEHMQNLLDPLQRFGYYDLLRVGAIEYVDTKEVTNCMIAQTPKEVYDVLQLAREGKAYVRYTHCEIHASMMLGIGAAQIPFPDHSQAPRNTFVASMCKQSMGVYKLNYRKHRFDRLAHTIVHPHIPIVRTHHYEHLKRGNKVCDGQTCIVAINVGGYNQEDSVIVNQSAIDRGLFRTVSYRVVQDKQQTPSSLLSEEFKKPQRTTTQGLKHSYYGKLDEDGMVAPGQTVSGQDILIGKITPISSIRGGKGKENMRFEYKDSSTGMKPHESGVVDSVLRSTDQDGFHFVKVRVRTMKIPENGDKVASTQGQKGTIGMTYRQEDMPYDTSGIVPDIIVNPHAIPSRMTIGMTLEQLLGIKSCLDGTVGDATAFQEKDDICGDISKALREYGYDDTGLHVLYSGRTGRRLTTRIFMGPAHYQRLKHLAGDKLHGRARGPMQKMTRQPTEGRARNGAQRFGEMERDALLAHGVSGTLRENFVEKSDGYVLTVCGKCGIPAIEKCSECQGVDIRRIKIPYAFKLLWQEMNTAGIDMRLITN